MTGRLPDILIIGAPKAGTTTIARWLADHPQVAMSAPKELEFLDKNFARGLDWYRGQFPEVEPSVRLGEATPTYLFDPHAPTRAATNLPDTRFIAVLREPVSRAWSNYWFFRSLGVERRTWGRAIAAETSHRDAPHPHYLDRGRYADQIARWDAAVGADRLLVLLFDELRADPVGLFSRICRFAGVRDDVVPPSTASVNPTHRPKVPALQWMLRDSGAARRSVGQRLWQWNLQSTERARLDPAQLHRLQALFVADNRRLEERLGRPLPDSWYAPAPSPRMASLRP